MDKDKPNRIFEEVSKTDKMKVYEYLSKRKNEIQKQVNTALSELHQAQSRFDSKNKEMNDEFIFEENIKKTIQKFEGYIPNPE